MVTGAEDTNGNWMDEFFLDVWHLGRPRLGRPPCPGCPLGHCLRRLAPGSPPSTSPSSPSCASFEFFINLKRIAIFTAFVEWKEILEFLELRLRPLPDPDGRHLLPREHLLRRVRSEPPASLSGLHGDRHQSHRVPRHMTAWPCLPLLSRVFRPPLVFCSARGSSPFGAVLSSWPNYGGPCGSRGVHTVPRQVRDPDGLCHLSLMTVAISPFGLSVEALCLVHASTLVCASPRPLMWELSSAVRLAKHFVGNIGQTGSLRAEIAGVTCL